MSKISFASGIALGMLFLLCTSAQVIADTDSFVSQVPSRPQLQRADSGIIERVYIDSPEMNERMTLDVWLSDGFDRTGNIRYPVIYMSDGQNLFDATTTWNYTAWEIDSVMGKLIAEHVITPAIVVGIHSSSDTRVADLMPVKAVQGRGLEAVLKNVGIPDTPIRGDRYAEFLVKTLKPYIDSHYPTATDLSNTTVMGSSMGGLMSIYALCEYPEVFGNALCLSTHWIGTPEVEKQFFGGLYEYIDANLPIDRYNTGQMVHKLYFDHGTETLDAAYGEAEKKIIELVKSKGYDDRTLMNLVVEGAGHDEKSWATRVCIPLKFVLGR